MINLNFRHYLLFGFVSTLLILSSCAKENNITQNDIELQILESHIRTIYNDTLQKTDSGAYYYTIAKGAGQEISDTCSILVNMSTMTLKYNYHPSSSGVFSDMSTNNEELAKQLGEYKIAYYYGERLFDMFDGHYPLVIGIREVLIGKKEGDFFRIIVPSWASEVASGTGITNDVIMIYDVEIVEVVNNYIDYQEDSLTRFSEKYYGGIDTVARGLYVKTLSEGEGDTLSSGNSANIRYVAKLLNGFVFDTNIEDTAKMYRIYNSENTYEEISLTISDEEEGAVSDGTDSDTSYDLPYGVMASLNYMKHGEKAVAFFWSYYGYHMSASWWSTEMSPKQYGGWQPLLYYIEVADDENDDEEEADEGT